MVILTVILVTLAVFAVLIVIAGVKGFFKGASEELVRQHGVLTKMARNFKARRIWKSRHKSAVGLPKEEASDVEPEES